MLRAKTQNRKEAGSNLIPKEQIRGLTANIVILRDQFFEALPALSSFSGAGLAKKKVAGSHRMKTIRALRPGAISAGGRKQPVAAVV